MIFACAQANKTHSEVVSCCVVDLPNALLKTTTGRGQFKAPCGITLTYIYILSVKLTMSSVYSHYATFQNTAWTILSTKAPHKNEEKPAMCSELVGWPKDSDLLAYV